MAAAATPDGRDGQAGATPPRVGPDGVVLKVNGFGVPAGLAEAALALAASAESADQFRLAGKALALGRDVKTYFVRWEMECRC